jgi:hypothetical protein
MSTTFGTDVDQVLRSRLTTWKPFIRAQLRNGPHALSACFIRSSRSEARAICRKMEASVI